MQINAFLPSLHSSFTPVFAHSVTCQNVFHDKGVREEKIQKEENSHSQTKGERMVCICFDSNQLLCMPQIFSQAYMYTFQAGRRSVSRTI